MKQSPKTSIGPRLNTRWGWVACMLIAAPSTQPFATELPESPPSYCSAVSLREDASLHAVAFANDQLGIAVGDRGTILRTEDGGGSWRAIANRATSEVACRLDDVLWINERKAVVVGGAYDRVTGISRGVVLFSEDFGRTWRRGNDSELPRIRRLGLRADDNVLVAVGDWAASVLSREFESRDGGKTWRNSGELDGPVVLPKERLAREFAKWSLATGTNVPIRDACRIGKSGLCAVGDHGVIVHSDDAGKTWSVARGDQRSTSVLVIADRPSSVAWPLVGSEALEMRNRVSVLIRGASERSSNDPATASAIDLTRQAAVMLGAAGADEWVPHAASAHRLGGNADSGFSQSIQDWIAVHRPRVVVVDGRLPSQLRAAVTRTSIAAGVSRIVSYSSSGRGESMLHSGALLPLTGVLASDMWQDAMQLVAPSLAIPNSISLRRLYDLVDSGQRGESVTTGLRIAASQRLSAETFPASRRKLQIVQARLSQPKQIEKAILASRTGADFGNALDALIAQTAMEDRFRLLWSVLVNSSDQALPVDFQNAARNRIAETYPDMSAGKWALLRSQSIEYSEEWLRMNSVVPNQLVDSRAEEAPAAEIVPVSPFQSDVSRVVQASATTPLQVARPRSLLVGRAPKKKAGGIDLAWEFHPLVLIARDAARNRGDENALQTADGGSANLRRLVEDRSARVWRDLIAGDREGISVVIARPAASPPRLDGRASDACWLANADAANPNKLQVAYDEDYVYVATSLSVDQLRSDSFVRTDSSPVRDHDLSQVDRLRLAIDTDQDLLTSMQFAATDAGRTHDAVDGHAQWNPTWYIAVDRTPTHVHFEFAIVRRDVTDLPIVPGESWFVSAKSIIGGSDDETVLPIVQDWTRVIFR